MQPGFNYVSQKAQWALWHKTAKEYNKYPNASGFSASVIELPCQIHYHGHPGLSLERQLDFGNVDDFLRFYVCEYDLICHKFDPNLDWDPGYCGSPLLGNWELMAFEKSHSVFLGAAISLLVKDELEPNAGHWLSFQKRMKEVESEEREMSLNCTKGLIKSKFQKSGLSLGITQFSLAKIKNLRSDWKREQDQY